MSEFFGRQSEDSMNLKLVLNLTKFFPGFDTERPRAIAQFKDVTGELDETRQ